jgi:hypothetical protein
MGRAYAGVLGYLAAALVLARGVVSGAGLESTLLTAVVAMSLFAAIGLVVGMIAQTTIDQAVREQLELELSSARTNEVS